MGLLIDGRWHDQWYDTGNSGRFQRESAQRRNWVTADGSAGPSGDDGFKAGRGAIGCGHFNCVRTCIGLSGVRQVKD